MGEAEREGGNGTQAKQGGAARRKEMQEMQEMHRKEAEEMRAQAQRWQQHLQEDYAKHASMTQQEKIKLAADQHRWPEEQSRQ
eukprot:9482363-Pyramimonas_sp.AAC.1